MIGEKRDSSALSDWNITSHYIERISQLIENIENLYINVNYNNYQSLPTLIMYLEILYIRLTMLIGKPMVINKEKNTTNTSYKIRGRIDKLKRDISIYINANQQSIKVNNQILEVSPKIKYEIREITIELLDIIQSYNLGLKITLIRSKRELFDNVLNPNKLVEDKEYFKGLDID